MPTFPSPDRPPPSPGAPPPFAAGARPFAAGARPFAAGPGPRAAAWEDFQRRRRTMRTLRGVMVGIGLVGGLLLMAAGATLIGAIIAGMAVARGVVLLVMTRRVSPRRP